MLGGLRGRVGDLSDIENVGKAARNSNTRGAKQLLGKRNTAENASGKTFKPATTRRELITEFAVCKSPAGSFPSKSAKPKGARTPLGHRKGEISQSPARLKVRRRAKTPLSKAVPIFNEAAAIAKTKVTTASKIEIADQIVMSSEDTGVALRRIAQSQGRAATQTAFNWWREQWRVWQAGKRARDQANKAEGGCTVTCIHMQSSLHYHCIQVALKLPPATRNRSGKPENETDERVSSSSDCSSV